MDGVPAFVRLGRSNPHNDWGRRAVPALTALRPFRFRHFPVCIRGSALLFRAISARFPVPLVPKWSFVGVICCRKCAKVCFSREDVLPLHTDHQRSAMYGLYSAFRFEMPSGEMVEWSITAVLKTAVPRGTGGSNPSLSAKWLQDDLKTVVKTAFKISVNRCKTYTYNDFSLYISLYSDG